MKQRECKLLAWAPMRQAHAALGAFDIKPPGIRDVHACIRCELDEFDIKPPGIRSRHAMHACMHAFGCQSMMKHIIMLVRGVTSAASVRGQHDRCGSMIGLAVQQCWDNDRRTRMW